MIFIFISLLDYSLHRLAPVYLFMSGQVLKIGVFMCNKNNFNSRRRSSRVRFGKKKFSQRVIYSTSVCPLLKVMLTHSYGGLKNTAFHNLQEIEGNEPNDDDSEECCALHVLYKDF